MTRRAYLHVGTLKTGTTFLQQVLWANRERLTAAGLVPAGRRYPDRVWAAQMLRDKGSSDPNAAGAWQRILDQSREVEGDLVISHEFFGSLDEARVTRVVEDLADREVHVVITARPLGSVLPALWQEAVKYGVTEPLATWQPTPLDSPVADNWSWRTVDAADVARRWSSRVPAERVHVVTYPPAGSPPDALWHRFAAAVGVNPDVADLDVVSANASLGVVQTELMRRFNQDLPEVLADEPARWLRRFVAQETLGGQAGERLTLPASRQAEIAERSAGVVASLAAAGYRVVGDLDELLEPVEPRVGRQPEEIGDAELLASALAGLRDMTLKHRRVVRSRGKVRRRNHDLKATVARLRGRNRELRKRLRTARQRAARAERAATPPPARPSRVAAPVRRLARRLVPPSARRALRRRRG